MKVGFAGSLESNDCMITVSSSDKMEIELSSIVKDYFEKQILEVLTTTLTELKQTKLKIKCVDKGALDYTIKARLITAISRMEEISNA